MALKILSVSEVIGMKVFTDAGDYIGMVEEAITLNNKIDSWKVRIARDSSLSAYLSGAKGLIIPHQFVKAIGEVMIISSAAVPEKEEKAEEE